MSPRIARTRAIVVIATVLPALGIAACGNAKDSSGTVATVSARSLFAGTPSALDMQHARAILLARLSAAGADSAKVDVDGTTLHVEIPGDSESQLREAVEPDRMFIRPVLGTVPGDVARHGSTKAYDRQSADPQVQQAAAAAIDCTAPDSLAGKDDPLLPLVTCDSKDHSVYLLGPAVIDGHDIARATAGLDVSLSNEWVINVTFTPAASTAWAAYTGDNVGKQTAITRDSQVISAETINQRIVGDTQISGKFTESDAKSLAAALRSGSLPVTLTVDSVHRK